ncbi:hypothetical protein [Alicyclobacillus fodiniaquatilis]|uniref:Flagellar protein FliT n=1 Tax=Alicyclobacillus fodiniaquatilis TaxID=1661150 RepID=A0ABW4JRP5_9BACL
MIDELLNQLYEIANDIKNALIKNDALRVVGMLSLQQVCLEKLKRELKLPENKNNFGLIESKIIEVQTIMNTNQKLIENGVNMSNYIARKIHKHGNLSYTAKA